MLLNRVSIEISKIKINACIIVDNRLPDYYVYEPIHLLLCADFYDVNTIFFSVFLMFVGQFLYRKHLDLSDAGHV